MKKKFLIYSYLLLFCSIVSLNFFSCSSIKNIKYFQDVPDSGQLKVIPTAQYIEPKIQVDDILTVLVATLDPNATLTINSGNVPVANFVSPASSSSSSSAVATSSGYLVDKNGYIDVPVLGQIKVVGYTTSQVKKMVQELAVKFYNNPTVIVRYANFKVTVTGEVARPSIYVIPNEKATILDALSIAGDLTIYGKRDNILLLRENADNTKSAYRINLTKTNLMSQPYFYLQQNDYIYVEPSKGKAAANDIAQTKNLAILTSIITVVVIIVSRIK